MKVVILAGGKGTRLKNKTENIPKPLVKITEKNCIEYQIESLKKYGLIDIYISVNYLGDKIIKYFNDGSDYGVNIKYIIEDIPLGTGGAFSYFKNIINDDFILLSGDVVLDIDWQKFIDFHKKNQGICTAFSHPNNHPFDSDIIEVDDNNKVKNILLKSDSRNSYYNNLVTSGLYIFSKRIFNYIEDNKKLNLEKDVLTKLLVYNENIFSYRSSEYVKDMGTEDRIIQVKNDIENKLLNKKALYNTQKCIFLDRDGTVNKYNGFISKPDELELIPQVNEAIKLINKSGYLAIIVTNQPVIARNMCTIDELKNIHNKLETLLGNKGAYLDDIFYCPHHPHKGYPEERKEYKIVCNCRKPAIELIEKATEKYNIDLKYSYIIGDTDIDIETGINAGLKTILINNSDDSNIIKSDYKFTNLLDAIRMIIKEDSL